MRKCQAWKWPARQQCGERATQERDGIGGGFIDLCDECAAEYDALMPPSVHRARITQPAAPSSETETR